MPPRVFQPVTRTIEASCQGVMDGQLVENKFYAQAVDAVTSAMVAEIAEIVESWVNTDLLPVLSNAYTHTRTIARDISVDSSFEFIDTSHAGEAGGVTGGTLPNNATIAIHRDTGLSGKKAKSRVYLTGLGAVTLLTQNSISAAEGTALKDTFDALRTAILAGTESTYLYGYPQRIIDGVKLTTGNFIEVLSHSLVDLVVDSMRARLPGHGL